MKICDFLVEIMWKNKKMNVDNVENSVDMLI